MTWIKRPGVCRALSRHTPYAKPPAGKSRNGKSDRLRGGGGCGLPGPPPPPRAPFVEHDVAGAADDRQADEEGDEQSVVQAIAAERRVIDRAQDADLVEDLRGVVRQRRL